MKIVGIDPSLSSTGVAVIVDGVVIATDVIRPKRWKKAPQTEEHRLERLDDITIEIMRWIRGREILASVEGLAFDGHDTRRQLAGLNWLLRHKLWLWEVPTVLVPPSTMKSFVGLGGRPTKLDLTREARRVFPLTEGVEIEDDNAGDALWLAEIGAAHVGCPVLASSAERVRQLHGVAWPVSDLAA